MTGLIEAFSMEGDDVEEKDVMLSVDEAKEKKEKFDDRELGRELSGEDPDDGLSIWNCSKVGVGVIPVTLERRAKISSVSSLSLDARSSCAFVRP